MDCFYTPPLFEKFCLVITIRGCRQNSHLKQQSTFQSKSSPMKIVRKAIQHPVYLLNIFEQNREKPII